MSKLKTDQDAANGLYARRRTFYRVIDRADETKVKVLAAGKTVHEQLVALRDPALGGDYVNPMKGFDVIIERVGTGKNDTKYKVFLARKESPLSLDGDIDQMQEWIDDPLNLDQFAKLPTLEEVQRLLAGEEPEEESDDEEEDAAPPRRALPAAKTGGATQARPASRAAATPPRSAAATPKRRTVEDDYEDAEYEDAE